MGRVVAERPGEWVMRADELVWDPVAERMDAFGAPARFEEAELVVTGPVLRYGWVDEVAWFPERAELVADGQSAVADRGRFEVPSGWLTLGGNVVVSGDGERVDSDSLRVHVEEGDVEFLGRSLVRGENGEWGVRCERGEWGDGAGWVAGGVERAWVRSGAEGVWADSLVWGEERRAAWGRVEAMDTAATRVVWGERWVQLQVDSAWVSRVEGGERRAELVQVEQGDTLHLVADVLVQGQEEMRAFPGVVFRQGEALGRCDTLIWLEQDSLMRFEQSPRMWFEGQILSADTLALHFRNAHPDVLHGLGHAHLTRALNDTCADQITGRSLHGTFHDGALDHLLIEGNAEAIYFVEEGNDLQFNRAACSRMRIHLADGRVHEIALLDAPSGRFLNASASTAEDRWLAGTQLQPAPGLPFPPSWPPRPASETWRPQSPPPQP